MKLFPIFTTLTILLAATSCGGSDKSDSVTYDVTASVVDAAEDSRPIAAATQGPAADAGSEPYRLGREHAALLRSRCHTTEEISDELLDINARTYSIRTRIGEKAADDYRAGIRDYLTECSDTLASILF